jgi:hypothetical protein
MKLGGLFPELKRLIETPKLAGLGPENRDGTLTVGEIDQELRGALEGKLTPAEKDLFRASVYLWHDHMDAAHNIVQDIETADGSLLHGIMHRREPDYGNAKYWFRRVGSHPSFLSLAVAASEYMEKKDETDLRSRLVPNKMWDPFAFVDAVEDAGKGKFPSKIPVLQHLQRLEFECFLENLANRI